MTEQTLKIEDIGEIKSFEVVRQMIFVAVYFYENSNLPYGITNADKNELIRQVQTWHGIDRTRPVRMYSIIL
jgi:hypothetical protein